MSQKDMLGTAVRKLVTLPASELGVVCDFLEKMADSDWVEATKRFIRKEEVWSMIHLTVWKTVKVGTMPDARCKAAIADARRKAIADAGMRLGEWGDDILVRIASARPAEVELVQVTVAELGFPDYATVSQIYAVLPAFNLEPCPAEVGYQLRLAYTDQPLDECIWVGMKPIAGSGGCPEVFHVKRDDGGLWLDASYVSQACKYYGDNRWVFARMSSGNS